MRTRPRAFYSGRRSFPELKKDAKFFRETWQIVQAANNGDKHFFIDLGKILSGEISGALCDKIDAALIEICAKKPTLNTRQIITALAERSILDVEEGTIRTRKSRLGLTQKRNCK